MTHSINCIALAGSAFALCLHPAFAQPMPPDGPPGAGPVGKRLAPFISPVGKPYRGPREAPYAIVDWFKAIDRGGKGYVTSADFEAEAATFFVELDIDKDGEIAPPEMERYEQQVAPEVQVGLGRSPGMDSGMPRGMPPGGMPRGGMPGGGGEMPGGGMGGPPGGLGGGEPPAGMMKRMASMPKGAAMFGLVGAPQPVASADTNLDRGVTLAELKGAAKRRFAMLDRNGAGRLTLADIPQTPIEKMLSLKR